MADVHARATGVGIDIGWRVGRRIAGAYSDGAQAGESARYCYGVWLRHLTLANLIPDSVVELGPGASLGVGYAALLSGANSYMGLDAVPRVVRLGSPTLLASLADLYRFRTEIPGPDEFPEMQSVLPDYLFPSSLISNDRLTLALSADRMEEFPTAISYTAPWASETVSPESVDMIVSQAVMEHVGDLDSTYAAMARWLRPHGLASHQIDFRSHDASRAWNGHWRYPLEIWRVMSGRADPINRQPLSAHLASIGRAGLVVANMRTIRGGRGIRRAELDPSFRFISDEDLSTAGAFLQLRRAS